MTLRDGNMKCTFSNVIKGERDQLEARNLSFQTFGENGGQVGDSGVC